MPTFYFDIETTGVKPDRDKIITIQYQEVDRNTAKPIGPLVIHKEWDSSEHEMLQDFVGSTRITDPYPFSFVPIGYNLKFENDFLRERLAAYGLPRPDILGKPNVDLQAIGVLMNKGEFVGSGLDKITNKPFSGKGIPVWYKEKEYWRIEDYVKAEAEAFLEWAQWLYKEMPGLREKWVKDACGAQTNTPSQSSTAQPQE
ncbi:ribonuclease H-like domain-containing protein [archaeon]